MDIPDPTDALPADRATRWKILLLSGRTQLLFTEMLPFLFAIAFRILQHRADAEDAAQDAALKLWRAPFDPNGSLPGLAAVIVSHEAVNRLRQRRRRKAVAL